MPIESSKASSNDVDTVMHHFRNHDLLPIMEILERKECDDQNECQDLLFQLYRQHIISLLEKGLKKDHILMFSKKLQAFGSAYSDQIALIMGAVVCYPDLPSRYSDLFHPNTWQVLEARIIKFISGIDSPLETL